MKRYPRMTLSVLSVLAVAASGCVSAKKSDSSKQAQSSECPANFAAVTIDGSRGLPTDLASTLTEHGIRYTNVDFYIEVSKNTESIARVQARQSAGGDTKLICNSQGKVPAGTDFMSGLRLPVESDRAMTHEIGYGIGVNETSLMLVTDDDGRYLPWHAKESLRRNGINDYRFFDLGNNQYELRVSVTESSDGFDVTKKAVISYQLN